LSNSPKLKRHFDAHSKAPLTFVEPFALEYFKNKVASAILPQSEGHYIITTLNEGVYILNNAGVEKIENIELDNLLGTTYITRAHVRENEYILGTNHGLIFLDNDHHVKKVVNDNNGIINNRITSLEEDAAGGLWIGSLYGLCRMDLSVPMTVYGEEEGLKGLVLTVNKHDDNFYVGTGQGLFKSKVDESYDLQFEHVEEIRYSVFDIIHWRDGILMSTNGKGILYYDGAEVR